MHVLYYLFNLFYLLALIPLSSRRIALNVKASCLIPNALHSALDHMIPRSPTKRSVFLIESLKHDTWIRWKPCNSVWVCLWLFVNLWESCMSSDRFLINNSSHHDLVLFFIVSWLATDFKLHYRSMLNSKTSRADHFLGSPTPSYKLLRKEWICKVDGLYLHTI